MQVTVVDLGMSPPRTQEATCNRFIMLLSTSGLMAPIGSSRLKVVWPYWWHATEAETLLVPQHGPWGQRTVTSTAAPTA
jgi:hypothetical protein